MTRIRWDFGTFHGQDNICKTSKLGPNENEWFGHPRCVACQRLVGLEIQTTRNFGIRITDFWLVKDDHFRVQSKEFNSAEGAHQCLGNTYVGRLEADFLLQLNTSCGFGLVVWVFLITLYFDQRKPQKKLINLNIKKHWWQIDRNRQTQIDMNLTCRFHLGLADSRHFHGIFMANPNMPKGKPWKCHESAMNLPWICHASAMKLFGKTIKITRKKAPWKCHESDIAVKLTRKCHESDMKAPWIRDEFAMTLTLRLDGHFWDGFSCWFGFFSGKKSEGSKCHERAVKPTWIWHIAKNEAENRQKKQIDNQHRLFG